MIISIASITKHIESQSPGMSSAPQITTFPHWQGKPYRITAHHSISQHMYHTHAPHMLSSPRVPCLAGPPSSRP